MPSLTFVVPANATSFLVTGSFGIGYFIDSVSTSWFTQAAPSGLQPGSFLVTFSVAAPAGGGTMNVSVVGAQPAASAPGVLLAGTIVNNVRDDVPDAVYDTGGNPLPDADGLQRASSLYRWLSQGVKEAARLMGTSLIVDWIAIPQVAFQPWYAVDPKWTKIQDGFSNQWPIDTITLMEGDVIWPNTSLTVSQSLFGYYRAQGAQLQFGLFPVPNISDPSTTLVGSIAASGVDPIALTSTLNFLAFGYVQIDQEIIQYQRLSTGPVGIQTISRGVCGTTATTHTAGATVQHLGLWLKGPRRPLEIVNSMSVVELPGDVQMILEIYLLARVRGSENEYDERDRLMKEFNGACAGVKADPTRKQQAWQNRAFGEATVGPLVWGGTTIRP